MSYTGNPFSVTIKSIWSDYQYRRMIDKAQGRDVNHAKTILGIAVLYLKNNQPPPHRVNQYLVNAIEQIRQGADANVALNMIYPKKRPTTKNRDIYIAYRYCKTRSQNKELAKVTKLNLLEEFPEVNEPGFKKIINKYHKNSEREIAFNEECINDGFSHSFIELMENELRRAAIEERGKKRK